MPLYTKNPKAFRENFSLSVFKQLLLAIDAKTPIQFEDDEMGSVRFEPEPTPQTLQQLYMHQMIIYDVKLQSLQDYSMTHKIAHLFTSETLDCHLWRMRFEVELLNRTKLQIGINLLNDHQLHFEQLKEKKRGSLTQQSARHLSTPSPSNPPHQSWWKRLSLR